MKRQKYSGENHRRSRLIGGAGEVLNGPFKGMRYPMEESVCSAYFPKIIGSYEKELWENLESLLEKQYNSIIDVGCAEGYYAVGLGLRQKEAHIYAYDTDELARSMCEKLSQENGLGEKLTIKGELTEQELSSFPFEGNSLIICDCEGFEKKLFTPTSIENLTGSDLIIETHDFLDSEISGRLTALFQKTHNITPINSSSDLEKVFTYHFSEIGDFNLLERFDVLAEHRPETMKWLVCEAK
ncbi:MAG: class I SAM-dependent methyltransferase [Bacteroidota bacterium]